jgi:hypothetical protein
VEFALTGSAGPWRVEATEGSQFVVKDANGFALAYVYARRDATLRDKHLTPAEALAIAEALAKLPELLHPTLARKPS